MKKILMVILVGSGLLMINAGCAQKNAPPYLIGVWQTQAPGYSRDHLQILTDRLVITANGQSAQYRITKIKMKKTDEETMIEIFCLDQTGEDNIFRFSYAAGRLHGLTEKDIVWYKTKP